MSHSDEPEQPTQAAQETAEKKTNEPSPMETEPTTTTTAAAEGEEEEPQEQPQERKPLTPEELEEQKKM